MTLRDWKNQSSPYENPLLDMTGIKIKRKQIRTGESGRELIDPETGEIGGYSIIHTIEEKDNEEFVKVFAAGVQASYGLNRTAFRVFQAILDEYQRTSMKKGYADSLYLQWFDGGLCGHDIGIQERAFQRGLKELLEKGFIYPRSASLFWVNPHLFFKGDRVAFVKEYRRKTQDELNSSINKNLSDSRRDPKTLDFIEGRADIDKEPK